MTISAKEQRVNYQIKAGRVYLIDEEGKNCGNVDFRFAIRKAEEAALDLVEIAFRDGIPVCKIQDNGKIKYAQQKSKKPQSKTVTKELKLSPRIDKHDIQIKVNQVVRWVAEGHKVFVCVKFRGRENTHREIGYEVLNNFKIENANVTPPALDGNMVFLWITKQT